MLEKIYNFKFELKKNKNKIIYNNIKIIKCKTIRYVKCKYDKMIIFNSFDDQFSQYTILNNL